MGYYPTPPRVAEAIRTWLRFPEGEVQALDPCCGEGDALLAATAGANVATWGVELDLARAEAASGKLTCVAKGAWEGARIVAPGGFGLLYLNPPYDWETTETRGGVRKETTFLLSSGRHLAPGGVLVWIVPRNRVSESAARYLARRFERVEVRRFPLDDDPFGQMVLFGVRKKGEELDEVLLARLRRIALEPMEPIAPVEEPVYEVPATPRPEVFRGEAIAPDEVVEASAGSPAWAGFERRLMPPLERERKRPPLPLHLGHIALLLAGGELRGAVGEGADRHLVRGMAEKYEVVETEEGEDGEQTTRTIERIKVKVRVLFPDGTVKDLS